MRINRKIKAVMLICLALLIIMSIGAFAATPKEMIENGVVSDGPIMFGDERDGIVSDISTDMNSIGEEIKEFGETVLSDAGDMINNPVSEIGEMANGTSDGISTWAVVFGIILAVMAAVAVIALIFCFTKRK